MGLLSLTYKIDNYYPHDGDFQDLINQYPHRKTSNSSYIIETILSPQEFYEELRMHINPGETLIISKFAKPWHGHGHKDIIDWIAERG